MITKKDIAEMLLAYLQHRLSSAELVDWAEKNLMELMEGLYEDDQFYTMRNILAKLGLADVKAFGLEFQDCEAIMRGCKINCVKELIITFNTVYYES